MKTIKALFFRQQALQAERFPKRKPGRIERKIAGWLSAKEQQLSPSERKAAVVLLCLIPALFFGHVLLKNLDGKAAARPVFNTGVVVAPDIRIPGDTAGIGDAWQQLRQFTDSIHH